MTHQLNSRLQNLLIVGSLCSAFVISGCSMVRMKVPANLKSGTDKYQVEGAGWRGVANAKNLTLGPHKITNIDKGWRKSTTRDRLDGIRVGIGGGSHRDTAFFMDGIRTRETISQVEFEFNVEILDEAVVRAQCVLLDFAKGKKNQSVVRRKLRCSLANDGVEDESQDWSIEMSTMHRHTDGGNGWSSTHEEKPRGTLYLDGRELQLTATYKKEGSSFDDDAPTGYYIKDGKNVIAAVDVLNKGTVYIARDVPRKILSTTIASAIALLISSREEMPEGPSSKEGSSSNRGKKTGGSISFGN